MLSQDTTGSVEFCASGDTEKSIATVKAASGAGGNGVGAANRRAASAITTPLSARPARPTSDKIAPRRPAKDAQRGA